MAPKVLHLSTYATNGGAARAATALHEAMLAEGLPSEMWTAHGPRFKSTQFLDRQLWRLQSSPVTTWRSPARFGSLTAKEINASDADIVNLHWVTDGFLSIEEIGKIEKPIVWSLYDMWPFAGTEHYGTDTEDARWRTGYTKANRPGDEHGIDIDRWTWQRKKILWTTPMHIVSASTWLQDRVSNSALMGSWPQHRIPHVIDCDAFAPIPRDQARTRLGLPLDIPLILFLASAGIGDHRKGWDLLEQALPHVKKTHPHVQVVVVGPPPEDRAPRAGVPILWHGSVPENTELALLYNAANVTAVPSREDNMPLTAMEAQSCGRSVVAFNIGGLVDIIEHNSTGFIAAANDTNALARGLAESLDDSLRDDVWGLAARERSLVTWSTSQVVSSYSVVYAEKRQ